MHATPGIVAVSDGQELSAERLSIRDSSMFMLILLTITSGIRQRTVASTNDALLTVDSARDEELKFFKERGLRFSRAGPGCSTCQVVLTQATRHRASEAEAQVWQDGELLGVQVCVCENHHTELLSRRPQDRKRPKRCLSFVQS